MSKCPQSRWKWEWQVKEMPSPFPCSPVIRESSWKKRLNNHNVRESGTIWYCLAETVKVQSRKQSDCKNKTTWLIQTTLSKSFSLFHTTYIETLKNLLKDYFFVQNLFYIERFSNEIVFKFSKNVVSQKLIPHSFVPNSFIPHFFLK